MTTAKPSVSDKRTPLTLPCTRSEAAPVCQLVRRVAEYNKVLWNMGLEIREENGLGELGIALAPKAAMDPWEDPRYGCETLARILLRNVLAHHRCIVAVEITFSLASPDLLSILQDKYSVRKLTISVVPWRETKAFETLEKLANPSDQNYSDAGEKYFCFSVRLPLFVIPKEQGSISLTALDVADLEISTGCTRQLIATLLQNKTISDLTVGSCVLTSGYVDLLHGFVLYLQKHRSPLKKLTVRTPEASKRALESLVKAIAPRTTLEELVIEIDIYDVEVKTVFAELMARNRNLRTLRVRWPTNCVRWMANCFMSSMQDGFELLGRDTATRIGPWLLALPENDTLLALTVDLLGFSKEECGVFFRALVLNKALQCVNIGYLPAFADLKEICQIIRDSRLAKAIHIQDHPLSIGSLPMLPECPEVTSVTVSSFHLKNSEILRRSFEILASCNHVTSLRVCVQECFLDEIQAAMAAYIIEALTLKDLEVHAYVDEPELEDQQHDPDAEKLLVNALASNLSLTRIALHLPLSEENCEFLANAFVNSQNLSELSFEAFSGDSDNAFLQTLASGIESNYRLLRADLPVVQGRKTERFAIRNITRRNASLVTRAARFVMGDHDPYNARAVELVSGHERVLSIVQENAGVDAREAATMVRRALGLRCLTGLEEYMILTGVVKRRVQCIGGRGRSVQLDELGYDCWIHIRKFLTVADVVGADCL